MTDAAPLSSANAAGWAFLGALASLGLVVAGIVLDEGGLAATVSQVLSALALPAWLAVGLHLATRGPAPSKRARALLILAVVVVMGVSLASVGALLFARHPGAALAFVAGCVVAGFCLERASSAS